MTHTDFEAKVAERANNALKSLANIEAKASSAADALVKECDLEAQTQLFRANASVAPAVFAYMQSKASSGTTAEPGVLHQEGLETATSRRR